MIRGHIEVVTTELVQGWIYSSDNKTRNKLVLAFSGDTCVGAGKVEHFRADLAQAGLGDGYLGFSFPITVEQHAIGSVTVKLEGSDAVLLQPKAVVSAASADATAFDQGAVNRHLSLLRWQLKNARISQTDFDYLRLLWSFGIYERTLLRRDEIGKAATAESAMIVAANLLEAYLGADATVSTSRSVNSANFKSELSKIAANPLVAPVVALCSTDRVAVRAREGSHTGGARMAEEEAEHVQYKDYHINPEKLVILDSRMTAELYTPAGQTIVMVMAERAFD